jgi:hypothetical protein
LVIVPSKIDSPIWGMITSVGIHFSFLARAARPAAHEPDYKSRPLCACARVMVQF